MRRAVCYTAGMTSDDTLDVPLRLLDWYREMGVDAAIGDEAIDWLARGTSRPGADYVLPAARATAPVPTQGRAMQPGAASGAQLERPERRIAPPQAKPVAPSRAFASTTPDAAVLTARTQAGSAQSIDELGRLLASFDGCGLKATAKNLFNGYPCGSPLSFTGPRGRTMTVPGRIARPIWRNSGSE